VSRRWIWIGALAVADAVVLALTFHAHADFRSGHGAAQTSVMTVGQALGWVIGVVLLIVLVGAVIAALRARR
jgi:uncharacterized membrane protein